jgi:hypothetical protein
MVLGPQGKRATGNSSQKTHLPRSDFHDKKCKNRVGSHSRFQKNMLQTYFQGRKSIEQ